MDIKDKLKKIPDMPGVYFMKNEDGKIIYIGKAISLKKRLNSHFRNYNAKALKQDRFIYQVRDIDYIPTISDVEALLLEADLIKKFKPRYNVSLRDDKSFPLIKITNEEFPRIFICRPKKKDKAKYFGPYADATAIRDALKEIRKIFPFRSCRKMPKKACLNFHIGLCPAPCIGKIFKNKYKQNIRNICLVLEGKRESLFKDFSKKMHRLAKSKDFEEAAKVRDQMMALSSVYEGGSADNIFHQIRQLKDTLELRKLPLRIEAFDISNIFGNEAVGSMVSFWQGLPDKNNYRRFRIRESQGEINDYKMLSEITRRRYERLKNEKLPLPDLIIIDGGKGQISVVKDQLEILNLDIPLIGIAKSQERIFTLDRKNPIKLPENNPALILIRRIRDEAHRFAISYHHILRRKKTFEEK